jgi:hypothetical protein
MAFNTETIREAIADRLLSSCELTSYPFDVATVTYPRAIVMPGSPFITYHGTFGGGLSELNFEIEVRATAADPVDAQIILSRFVNAGTGESLSVIDALELVSVGSTTPTLGVAVENIVVTDVSTPPGVQLTEGPFEFTATFTVAVLARRN